MNYSFAIPASFKSQHWDDCRLALVDCPGQLLRKFHTYRAEMVKKLQPLMQARVLSSVPNLWQAAGEPAGQEWGSGSRWLQWWLPGGGGATGGKGGKGGLISVKRCPHGFFLASCHMHTM
ncbi:unnamed protein product, partial [Closterium sp. NIES-54]